MLPTARPAARNLADVLPDCLELLTTAHGPAGVDHIIVVLVDGLGAQNLSSRRGHARTLTALRSTTIASVFPSTTAAALTSLATGTLPGRHGIVGYAARDLASGRVVNQISGWDELVDSDGWQRETTVFQRAVAADVAPVAIGPASFARSGFTRHVLSGAEYRAADSLSDRVDAAVAATRRAPRTLSYLYVPELDKAGHRFGSESPEWTAALEQLDQAFRRLLGSLPKRTGVLVTADHGMVDVPAHRQLLFGDDPALMTPVVAVGGEPRMLHLYGDGDMTGDDREALAAVWRDAEGERSWVLSREDAIMMGLFGDVDEEVVPRIGDVLVAARARVAYYDGRLGAGDPARRMVGQHGSMTDEETRIPLLAAGAFADGGVFD
ncbi:alkaline phosphatase family protein [Mycetocola reblochoni]|nr:alkaline phosphatase family protein [Mycetocola reblochoni]